MADVPVLVLMLVPMMVGLMVIKAAMVITAPLWVPPWLVWRAADAIHGWWTREELVEAEPTDDGPDPPPAV